MLNRVPETLTDGTDFVIQQTYNSVNEEDKTVIRLDASAGNFAFHLDAFRRDSLGKIDLVRRFTRLRIDLGSAGLVNGSLLDENRLISRNVVRIHLGEGCNWSGEQETRQCGA